MEMFDFIVIGAGSAGCVVANRLRESASSAFLRPAMKGQNVRVETDAHVTRILFDDPGYGADSTP